MHEQLGIPQDEVIPSPLLREIINTPIGGYADGHKVTRKLKQRAVWAENVR